MAERWTIYKANCERGSEAGLVRGPVTDEWIAVIPEQTHLREVERLEEKLRRTEVARDVDRARAVERAEADLTRADQAEAQAEALTRALEEAREAAAEAHSCLDRKPTTDGQGVRLHKIDTDGARRVLNDSMIHIRTVLAVREGGDG